MRTDEYVHGAVGTLHTCLLLSNFQQVYVHILHVHVHVGVFSTNVQVRLGEADT